MDWSAVRQWSQIALIAFSLAGSGLAWVVRGRKIKMVYMGHVICGLLLFATWMTLSSLSIRGIGPFTRDQFVPYIASVEALTAFMAWSWLLLASKATFSLSFNRRSDETGASRSANGMNTASNHG
jgi:hypothetical protein